MRKSIICCSLALLLAGILGLAANVQGWGASAKAASADVTPTPGITSCGVPVSQATCGWYMAHYVFYQAHIVPNFLGLGSHIEYTPVVLPGAFCFICLDNGDGGPVKGKRTTTEILASEELGNEAGEVTSVGHLTIDETASKNPLTNDEKWTAQFLSKYIYNDPQDDLLLKNVDNQARDGSGNTADLTRTNVAKNIKNRIDIISPITRDDGNVISAILKKNGQVGPNGEVALNLRNSKLKISDMGNVMARLVKAAHLQNVKLNISRVIVIQDVTPGVHPAWKIFDYNPLLGALIP
ncbi:hypothetical protein EPA93_26895 [Ktedonosporobacter rubrisoli]|uniref:GerMN domain-containing protein n=1 Tax=Ktedonosporobacter rubrisoli TaxID=2509675 RepID=A0A4P6JUU1_KTERU|nr:hypothetical protein [Ktedonosporobacter rubrisoli]QBD79418.1 hypothetical protein EPA93_26895 [Ktedonosporobacter rubrisoli]